MELSPISSHLPPATVPAPVVDAAKAQRAPDPAETAETAPPPAEGFHIETARNEATGLPVTKILSPQTGEVIVQIPLERVLDRVALLLEQQQRTDDQ